MTVTVRITPARTTARVVATLSGFPRALVYGMNWRLWKGNVTRATLATAPRALQGGFKGQFLPDPDQRETLSIFDLEAATRYTLGVTMVGIFWGIRGIGEVYESFTTLTSPSGAGPTITTMTVLQDNRNWVYATIRALGDVEVFWSMGTSTQPNLFQKRTREALSEVGFWQELSPAADSYTIRAIAVDSNGRRGPARTVTWRPPAGRTVPVPTPSAPVLRMTRLNAASWNMSVTLTIPGNLPSGTAYVGRIARGVRPTFNAYGPLTTPRIIRTPDEGDRTVSWTALLPAARLSGRGFAVSCATVGGDRTGLWGPWTMANRGVERATVAVTAITTSSAALAMTAVNYDSRWDGAQWQWRLNATPLRTQEIGTAAGSWTWSNLAPNTRYTVRARGVGRFNVGNWSPWVSFDTSEGTACSTAELARVPGKALIPWVTSRTTTTATARTWSRCALRYNWQWVRWTTGDPTWATATDGNSTVPGIDITSLAADTIYAIRARGVNNAGVGAWSDPGFFDTAELENPFANPPDWWQERFLPPENWRQREDGPATPRVSTLNSRGDVGDHVEENQQVSLVMTRTEEIVISVYVAVAAVDVGTRIPAPTMNVTGSNPPLITPGQWRVKRRQTTGSGRSRAGWFWMLAYERTTPQRFVWQVTATAPGRTEGDILLGHSGVINDVGENAEEDARHDERRRLERSRSRHAREPLLRRRRRG